MFKLQVLIIPPSALTAPIILGNDGNNHNQQTNELNNNHSYIQNSTLNAISTPIPNSLLVNRYGINNSYLFPSPFVGSLISPEQVSIKKFLHLTKASNNLRKVAEEINDRYLKLYPDQRSLDIIKIQDFEECDLDPDYQVSMVFDNSNICRVLVANEFTNEFIIDSTDASKANGKRRLAGDLNKVMKKFRKSIPSSSISIWNNNDTILKGSNNSNNSNMSISEDNTDISTKNLSLAIPNGDDTVIHPTKSERLLVASPIIAIGSPSRITSGMLSANSQPDLSKNGHEGESDSSTVDEPHYKRASVPSKEDVMRNKTHHTRVSFVSDASATNPVILYPSSESLSTNSKVQASVASKLQAVAIHEDVSTIAPSNPLFDMPPPSSLKRSPNDRIATEGTTPSKSKKVQIQKNFTENPEVESVGDKFISKKTELLSLIPPGVSTTSQTFKIASPAVAIQSDPNAAIKQPLNHSHISENLSSSVTKIPSPLVDKIEKMDISTPTKTSEAASEYNLHSASDVPQAKIHNVPKLTNTSEKISSSHLHKKDVKQSPENIFEKNNSIFSSVTQKIVPTDPVITSKMETKTNKGKIEEVREPEKLAKEEQILINEESAEKILIKKAMEGEPVTPKNAQQGVLNKESNENYMSVESKISLDAQLPSIKNSPVSQEIRTELESRIIEPNHFVDDSLNFEPMNVDDKSMEASIDALTRDDSQDELFVKPVKPAKITKLSVKAVKSSNRKPKVVVAKSNAIENLPSRIEYESNIKATSSTKLRKGSVLSKEMIGSSTDESSNDEGAPTDLLRSQSVIPKFVEKDKEAKTEFKEGEKGKSLSNVKRDVLSILSKSIKNASKTSNHAARKSEISGDIDLSNILPSKNRHLNSLGTKNQGKNKLAINSLESGDSNGDSGSDDSEDDSDSSEDEQKRPKVVKTPKSQLSRTTKPISSSKISTLKIRENDLEKPQVIGQSANSLISSQSKKPIGSSVELNSKRQSLPKLSAFLDKKLPEVRIKKHAPNTSVNETGKDESSSEESSDSESESDSDSDPDSDSSSDSDSEDVSKNSFIDSKSASILVSGKSKKNKKKNKGFFALMKDSRKM